MNDSISKYELIFSTLESMVLPLESVTDRAYDRGDRLRIARTVRAKGPSRTGLTHWLVHRVSKHSDNTLVIGGHVKEDGRLAEALTDANPFHDALFIRGDLARDGNDFLLSRYVNERGLLTSIYIDSAGYFFRRYRIGRFFLSLSEYCADDCIIYLLG